MIYGNFKYFPNCFFVMKLKYLTQYCLNSSRHILKFKLGLLEFSEVYFSQTASPVLTE